MNYPASDAFRTAAPADTPKGAEDRLEKYQEALEQAGKDLADAADAETDAELARDSARDSLLLDDNCPKCGTFDHVRVTVAERDAWVNSQITEEERSTGSRSGPGNGPRTGSASSNARAASSSPSPGL